MSNNLQLELVIKEIDKALTETVEIAVKTPHMEYSTMMSLLFTLLIKGIGETLTTDEKEREHFARLVAKSFMKAVAHIDELQEGKK